MFPQRKLETTTLVTNPLICPYTPYEIAYVSSVLSTTGIGSPSSESGRLRRSYGSSTDEKPETAWDGFTEADLRAGGPNLPELPCEALFWLPRTHRYYKTLRGEKGYLLENKIQQIARNGGVDFISMHFCHCWPIPVQGQEPILTALVYAQRHDRTSRGNWIAVARHIREFLHNEWIDDITVEILDYRVRQRWRVHPCVVDDAIYPIWRQVCERILATLGLTGLITVGCHRIGMSDDRSECSVTVLIGVNGQVKRDWRQARETVVTVLQSFQLPMVGVLIRKDASVFQREGRLAVEAASVEVCTKEVHLGNSISSHHDRKRHGTLGGLLELLNPHNGEWLPFAITCAHCIFPPDSVLRPDPALQQTPIFSPAQVRDIENWKHQGVPVGDTQAAQLLRVDSPSFRDLKDGIKSLEDTIESNKDLDIYKAVEQAKAADEFVMPPDESAWRLASDTIKDQSHRRTIMKGFLDKEDFLLGSVAVASGLQDQQLTTSIDENLTAVSSVLDWALIRPQHRIAGQNKLPRDGSLRITHLAEMQHSFSISNDKLLFKVGRTTGLTAGLYNGLKTAHIATRKVNGQDVTFTTWEHTLVATSSSRSVVEAGDSGSLVFSETGLVVGLCFGGTLAGDVGYFTHIGDVVDSIKAMTGVKEIRLKGPPGIT